MTQIVLDRYPIRRGVATSLSPLDDVFDWIQGLRSPRVLNELAVNHPALKSLKLAERRIRTKAISAHIDAAIGYIEFSRAETGSHAFLNIYYGLLNLAKAVILMGSKAEELRKQQRHGVSYVPYKQPNSFLTDWITLHPAGAVPLYYETISGEVLKETKVTLSDVYRYL